MGAFDVSPHSHGYRRMHDATAAAAADRAREALLIVTRAIGASVEDVREAREERRMACDRRYDKLAQRAADVCSSGACPDGASANASAKTPRHALLLAWQAVGTNANAACKERESLLCYAARAGHVPALRLALARGACPDALCNFESGRRTALVLVAWHGHADCLRLLLEAGACGHKKADSYGPTPLYMAAFKARTECVRLLLEAGADVDDHIHGGTGTAPIHLATACGSTECLRLLLEAGADINRASASGRAPLHCAASSGNIDCLRLLLEAGADASAIDKHGRTALDLANMYSRNEEAALLRQYCPRPSGSTFAPLQAGAQTGSAAPRPDAIGASGAASADGAGAAASSSGCALAVMPPVLPAAAKAGGAAAGTSDKAAMDAGERSTHSGTTPHIMAPQSAGGGEGASHERRRRAQPAQYQPSQQ